MRKSLTAILGVTVLLVSLAAIAQAQTTQTTTVTKVQTVQNPDGTYTIVEYPVGKETTVILNPVGIAGATGTATIMRDATGATIKVNLTNLPADTAALNLYAVDPTGAVTALGPVEIANGVGTFTTKTPMTRFMLVASPDANLTAYDANTKIFFRSDVPTGLAVIPISKDTAVGEQVAVPVATAPTAVLPVATAPTAVMPVTTAPTAAVTIAEGPTEYTVPMLGIPNFKTGDESKLKVNFTGALDGARANVFIEPHKNGKMTEIRIRFHDLKEAPRGLSYVIWAVSPDNQFQRLGQVVNARDRNEAEIRSETALEDFGLLVTTEDAGANIIKPVGHRVGVVTIIK